MSLNKRILVKKCDFEGKFTLTSLYKKFIYLSSKIDGNKVSMLIDIGSTNLFMSPNYAKMLKLIQEQTKGAKVSFAHGKKITNLVVKNVEFKCGNIRFHKDFTMCKLNVVDVVLRNNFLDFYRIKLE